MSFAQNLDNLKVYIESELTEKVLEAMEILVDKFTESQIENVNNHLIYGNFRTVNYYFNVEDLTIKLDKLEYTVNIIKTKPICYEQFIKKILMENKTRICDKFMLKYFDGIFIDNHFGNGIDIGYTVQKVKNSNCRYLRIISDPNDSKITNVPTEETKRCSDDYEA
jgi:hypothetical protein